MKIVHCADVHLGSAFEKFDPAKRAERKAELRATFERMADFAAKEGASAVLICGDLFDTARPPMDDKRFFYSVVRRHSDLNFYYLRGNHDTEEGFGETLPNLFTFGEGVTEYDLDGVRIAGCEMPYLEQAYNEYNPEPGSVNILMLHGQFAESGVSGDPDTIYKKRLEGKNLSYIALGHIHSFREYPTDRGVAVYPGCLEGRGYDETGEHGFVMINIERDVITHEFVPFAKRNVLLRQVDLTGTADAEEGFERIAAAAGSSAGDMMRIELTGEVPYPPDDAAREAEHRLSGCFYGLSVKNYASEAVDLSALAAEVSLRGEFYRVVMKDESIPEADREEVVRLGLRLLAGEGAGR